MRFSVLVTVYNAERYVGACLDALCAQTYADFEIVVVDDGSSDGSGRICDSYAERDRRVRVLHTEKRRAASICCTATATTS
jgi:glycosyltransferase involved in cell wall biosynthesis